MMTRGRMEAIEDVTSAAAEHKMHIIDSFLREDEFGREARIMRVRLAFTKGNYTNLAHNSAACSVLALLDTMGWDAKLECRPNDRPVLIIRMD